MKVAHSCPVVFHTRDKCPMTVADLDLRGPKVDKCLGQKMLFPDFVSNLPHLVVSLRFEQADSDETKVILQFVVHSQVPEFLVRTVPSNSACCHPNPALQNASVAICLYLTKVATCTRHSSQTLVTISSPALSSQSYTAKIKT